MRTLLELVDEMRSLGQGEALRFFNGYRTWKLTYADLLERTAACAAWLRSRGLGKGDRVILWGENRPEWAAAFWACVCLGIESVPLDYRSSRDFAGRIAEETDARLLLFGDSVEPGGLDLPRADFDDLGRLASVRELPAEDVNGDDVVEIVYTSGTTGEPKGVVHRHRNICANLSPIKKEIGKYRLYAWPFQPIRLLDTLPLSHMFGQALGLFIPPLLGGAAVFTTELHPASLREAIRRERASVLVSVPRLVQSLQAEISRRFALDQAQPLGSGWLGVFRRWWRYRDVHSALGWKFWALVVGGAEVDPSINAFWQRLGYVVVQGYGMTETSPVVALNHPFKTRPGSIGEPLPGMEVRLSGEGEILVRGESVVDEYAGRAGGKALVDEEGWLHTGDLGEFDSEGRLHYRGRKKDVIVTSEGLNVHPEDVEKELEGEGEVAQAVVVAVKKEGGEQVHAAVMPADGESDVAGAVRRANSRLEAHQRVRSWSLWTQGDFPRTSSTLKVKRRLVAEQVARQSRGPVADGGGPSPLEAFLAELSGQPPEALQADQRLGEDLGLSSLDRVELMSKLEDEYQIRVDEEGFAEIRTVGELKEAVREASRQGQPGGRAAPEAARESPEEGEQAQRPRQQGEEGGKPARPGGGEGKPPERAARQISELWYGRLVREVRILVDECIVLPLFRKLVRLEAKGLEHVRRLEGPVIFAANHVSHLDVPSVASALDFQWRYRLAPAMREEYFLPILFPQRYPLKRRLASMWFYLLAAGLFAGFPLPQRLGGVRRSLRFSGKLADRGYSILIFPEGRRTDDGSIGEFQPGVGVMARQLKLPVVPVRLDGLFEVYSKFHDEPVPGPVRVTFGPAVDLRGAREPAEVASRVESAVRSL